MSRLLVFGDSIAAGTNVPTGGWVQLLNKYCFEKRVAENVEGCTVYNLSVSGDTSRSLLKRIHNEIDARVWYSSGGKTEGIVVVVNVGVNDSAFVIKDKDNWVPQIEFEANTRKIIGEAISLAERVFVLGITGVDDSKVSPIPWAPELCYLTKYVRNYNDILRNISAEEGVIFIDVFSKLSGPKWNKTISDGVHPNDEGHELIYRIVHKYLKDSGVL